MIRWINDAQREIARNNHLLETKATADIVAAQSDYNLPADLLELWSVRYDNYKIKALSMEEADLYITNVEDSHQYTTGLPVCYHQWENKITLYPIPDAAYVGGLTVYYTRFPINVQMNGDVPELPLKYHGRIVEYCLAQAYELDEDYNASNMKVAQLDVQLKDMLESEKWVEKSFYPTITTLPDDSW